MKKRLLKSLHPLAAQIPLNWLVQLTGQRLFMPFYHSVQKAEPLPHIQHLYPLRNIETFEKEIDFFLKHYQPINLTYLLQHLKTGKPFEQNTFFLSFDDGLREVYDVIEPILSRKGVPATFFLNSAFVDNKDLFFRYKASLLIDHLKKHKLKNQDEKAIQQIFSASDLRSAILKINYRNTHLLDVAAEHLNLNFKDFLKDHQPYLTSNQIKQLIQKGYTFGSHSIDHPLYSELNLQSQITQTRESQLFINEHFPQDIKAFAFPFTDHQVSKAFFDEVQSKKIIDISFGTAGLKKDTPDFHLQRFPVEEFPFPINELVPSAYFYYFGKSFLGKNKIRRS